MTTNFPTSLDTNTELPVESASTKLSVNHVVNHTNVRDAIKAIEAKIGIDASAVTTSFDYKLSEVVSGDKAVGKTATQTLTNKTLTAPIINVGSDATGDIYYRNSGGAFTRLPIGTNGYILKVNTGIPAWQIETTTANASTTVAGIVEIATTAEIQAGTSTGGTGAILAIPASAVGAAGTANALVQYDSNGYYPTADGRNITNLSITAQQQITYFAGTSTEYASGFAVSTSMNGSVMVIGTLLASGALKLFRLAKDAKTQQFEVTHTGSFNTVTGTLDSLGIMITTSYAYCTYRDNGTLKLTRFDIADVTNGTNMTYSGSAPSASGSAACHTDGTDLYIYTASSTYYKYTISGTTATNAATITYTSAGVTQILGSYSDGTSAWMSAATGTGAVTILKYPLAGGASTGSASYVFEYNVFPNSSPIKLFHVKAGVLGLAQATTIASASVITGTELRLRGITTP